MLNTLALQKSMLIQAQKSFQIDEIQTHWNVSLLKHYLLVQHLQSAMDSTLVQEWLLLLLQSRRQHKHGEWMQYFEYWFNLEVHFFVVLIPMIVVLPLQSQVQSQNPSPLYSNGGTPNIKKFHFPQSTHQLKKTSSTTSTQFLLFLSFFFFFSNQPWLRWMLCCEWKVLWTDFYDPNLVCQVVAVPCCREMVPTLVWHLLCFAFAHRPIKKF